MLDNFLFSEILDHAPGGVAFSDTNKIYRFVNKKYEDFLGLSRDEIIGKSFADLVPRSNKTVAQYHDRVLKGESVQYQVDILYRGQKVPYHISHQPVFRNKKIIGYTTYGMEISENRQLLERQATLLKALPSWVLVIDRDFCIREIFNTEKLSVPKDLLLGRSIFDPEITVEEKDRIGGQTAALKAFQEGSGYYDYYYTPTQVYLRAWYHKLNDQELMVTSQNMTTLKNEIEYKEGFIKEIHHRVKNNFYVIDSLFNLELRRTTDTNCFLVLQNLRTRLQGMARLHEILYVQAELRPIKLNILIEKIAKFLNQELPDLHYKNLAQMMIATEKGIALGSILIELYTNSLKQHLQTPLSCFLLTEERDRQIHFYYFDTGCFYQKSNHKRDPTQGLGLKLIDLFCQKLDGEFEYTNASKIKSLQVFGQDQKLTLDNIIVYHLKFNL